VGIFGRFVGGQQERTSAQGAPLPPPGAVFPTPGPADPRAGWSAPSAASGWVADAQFGGAAYGGGETLEVVGESYRQDELWAIVKQRPTSARVSERVVAELILEPRNQHDRNAVAVWVRGRQVGYLSREDAAVYQPGVARLSARGPVTLNAVIVGGGYDDDDALLGVFMDHDPTDFGVTPHTQPHAGVLRTGMSEAIQTDLFDDSYDLSWVGTLPENTRQAITRLRELLGSDSDPIDRHFMFAQLECRLYHLRDVEPSALDDYDEACSRHDGEMATIRAALHSKFRSVPLLETYRQQCIRQQKAKDYHRGLWWAERGLALYGNEAHSPDWTDDLKKRAAWFHAKLQPPATKVRSTAPGPTADTPAAMETLTCSQCGSEWERRRTRGRKPGLCSTCAGRSRTDDVTVIPAPPASYPVPLPAPSWPAPSGPAGDPAIAQIVVQDARRLVD
jgi:hypothetical protein